MKKIKLDEMCLIQGGSCTVEEAVNNTPFWAWIIFGASAWLIVGLNRDPCGGQLTIELPPIWS
ncbi:hypothetical protein [Emticicia sp. W12TSBA100-4]|uniref:hypothetical protein n=1 Tax=Emticicia sp. W12TSBA100-4 TaxID=3160965 RepID=UPI0033060A07